MRRKRNYKRDYEPDLKYGSVAVARFRNCLMHDGKQSVADGVLYGAFERIEKETKQNPIEVFNSAMENAAPSVEVTTQRVGGASYQVPREVRPERKFMLAARWIIQAARAKKGKPMEEKLAQELLDAAKNDGAAIKKKQDMHRMAEANRAFAHFRRR